MNTAKILGRVLAEFDRVNPHFKVKKVFTKEEDDSLRSLIDLAHSTKDAGDKARYILKYLRLLSNEDNFAFRKGVGAILDSDWIGEDVKSSIRSQPGSGRLNFVTNSPPGAGRLCRVPFYPMRATDAWSTRFLNIDTATPSRQPFGIDIEGDDPILNIGPWLGNQNSTRVGPYLMGTHKIEFGAYRMIGLEVNAFFGSRYIGAVYAGDPATGFVQIDGDGTKATGSVENVGPAATAASGSITIGGTPTASTVSLEFVGTPNPSTGNIRVVNDGTAASIDIRMPGIDPARAQGKLVNDYTGSGGRATLQFTQGDKATGQIDNLPARIQNNDTFTLTNTVTATGVTQVVEVYTAKTTPTPGSTTEFQATTVDTSITALVSLINAASTGSVFEASWSGIPGTGILQFKQKFRGTFGNNSRGSLIQCSLSFGGAAPNITQFSSGTDGIEAGAAGRIEIIDKTGTTRVYNPILSSTSAPNAANNEFMVWGESDAPAAPGWTGGNLQASVQAGISAGTSAGAFPGGAAGMGLSLGDASPNTIFLQFTTGYLPTDWVSVVPGSVTTSYITSGEDTISYNTTITIEDTAGVSTTFAAQPLGTTVPSGTPFQTFPTQLDTMTSLRNAIIAVYGIPPVGFNFIGPATPVGGTHEVDISQSLRGRIGNIAIVTNYNGGTDSMDNTGFTGGTSPLTNGIELVCSTPDSGAITFTGTDGATPTTTTFNTNGENSDTLTRIITCINSNTNFTCVALGANEFQITQVVAGGNPAITTTQDTELWLGLISGNSPTTFTGGTDALPTGATANFTLTNTAGASSVFQMVTTPSVGLQIQVKGTAAGQATEIATHIQSTGLFLAVVDGGDNQRVNFTQITAGMQGDQPISIVNLVPELTKADFTGGSGVYPVGGTMNLTDAQDPPVSENFFATVSTESATQFISNASPGETATSLLNAINASAIQISGNVVGNILNLTQDIAGPVGDTTITPSAPAEVSPNPVAFSGGAYIVPVGATVTIKDSFSVERIFTGFGGPGGPLQFDVTGTANQIASSLDGKIGAQPLNLSKNLAGSEIQLTMDEIGTIGNSAGAGALPTNIAAPDPNITVVNFNGGTDNVSVGTSATLIDSAGTERIMSGVRGAPALETEFTIDNGNPGQTMLNLVNRVNAIAALDITGFAVGVTANFTQGTDGTAGNTTISTNNATQFNVSGFSNGKYSVEVGAQFTLEDSTGVIQTYTAVDAGATTATQFLLDPVRTNILTNMNTAVTLSGIGITGAVVDPRLNLTQNAGGTAGNTPIGVFNPPGTPVTLSVSGFAGGTGGGLNLVNPLSPVGITLRELTVYNGDNIFVVEDSQSLSAGLFNILNRSQQLQMGYIFNGIPITPTGQTAQPLSQFSDEKGYKFVGFRDQPVVDPNAMVFVKVEAFIKDLPVWNTAGGAGGGGTPYPNNTPLPKIPPIPFSINLVVDVLDDRVFGDPYAPSPASRAGSNIKLSKTELPNDRVELYNVKTEK